MDTQETQDPRGRRFPREFLRQLRERVDIVELIGTVVAMRPVGRELVGLCPFHEERTPSFHVSREKQLFHCYGCQAGGDAVDFVMRHQGLSFAEAVPELAARAGLPLPDLRPLSAEQRRRLQLQEESLAACAAAAEYFRSALLRSAGREAIGYLRQRGVDGPTAERFGLGFAPADWDGLGRALAGRFAPEALVRAGLRRERQGGGAVDYFRGRLMFPIWDGRGRVIAFGGRALTAQDQPKYLNSPETPLFRKRDTLYALHLARPGIERARRVVVVEGYMDALACHQFGFGEVVALLGTALSEHQAGVLARLAETLTLAFDADPAGGAATERGLALLQEQGVQMAVAQMPAGKDPDEALRAPQGPAAFRAALDQAVPLIPYLLRRVLDAQDVGRLAPERRWRLAERLVPYLARVPASMGKGTRQEYIELVARTCGLREPQDLERAVERHAPEGLGHKIRNTWNPTPMWEGARRSGIRSAGDSAEETVLAACLRSARWLGWLSPQFSIHDFRRTTHQTLAASLLALGPGGADTGSADPPGDVLLDQEEDPGARSLIARLLALELPAMTPLVLRQCLRTMRRSRLLEEVEALRATQRRLVAEGQGQSPEMLVAARRLLELTAELARSARDGGDEDGPADAG